MNFVCHVNLVTRKIETEEFKKNYLQENILGNP